MAAAASDRKPRKPKKSIQRYLDAEWGIRNHWYPALFSHELGEDDVQGITLGGEQIAFRRANGKAFGFRDECVHRGVRISARPTCLTKETVTCWYHGFTYSLEDGGLCDIVASKGDPLIGRARIRTYPVAEVTGIIFVFLGDEDFEPPPLAHDLPFRPNDDCEFRSPYLLDEDALAFGIRRKCTGDWRLAAESGGDPGHIMIHRESALVLSLDTGLSLGEPLTAGKSLFVDEGDWPIGITKYYDNIEPVMAREDLNIRTYGTREPVGLRVSLYLPGILYVENWPLPGITQYEWYTPVEKGYHNYWQVLVRNCSNEHEREDFALRYRNCWEELALKSGFNDDDIFAREAMEAFYANGRGWKEERLFSLDQFIVEWRKLVQKYARGIQPPPP